MIINVRDYVAAEKEKLKQTIKDNNLQPRLMIVQVGDNPASNSYIKGKMKDCDEVGIEVILEKHEEDWFYQQENMTNLHKKMKICNGIIIQLPIVDKTIEYALQSCIYPEQDVDGLIYNIFQPCTPIGIIKLLKYLKVELQGCVITILGKGELVGKPLLKMLMNEGATVISCNSKTKDVNKWMRQSDVIIGATGVPDLITEESIGDNVIIIDAGTGIKDGKLHGDCSKELYENSLAAVTPVPGGVGLITRLTLLQNVVDSTLNFNILEYDDGIIWGEGEQYGWDEEK